MPDTMPTTAATHGDRAPSLNSIAVRSRSLKNKKVNSPPPTMISDALVHNEMLSSRCGLS